MDFTGTTCGICNKGKLHPVKDEVSRGIYVDGYRCDRCGEISYSREVMQKVEAMQKSISEERRLVKVGSSVAALIPSSIVRKLQLKPRERVYIHTEGKNIVIQPSPA